MNRFGLTCLWVALAVLTTAAGRPPATRPTFRPTSRPTSRPASRPATTRVAIVVPPPAASRPATRPTTRAAAIDLSTVATQAESVSVTLRQMEADALADPITARVQQDLPPLAAEIAGRLDDTASLLASHPSLQVLDGQSEDWLATNRELDGWSKGLRKRYESLRTLLRGDGPNAVSRLDAMEEPWRQSRETAAFYAVHAPTAELRQQMLGTVKTIDDVVAAIDRTREELRDQDLATFAVLSQVDAQQAKVAEVLESVREARDQAWNRLFQRDGDPIWQVRWQPHGGNGGGTLASQEQGSFHRQLRVMAVYSARHRAYIGLHVALVALLAAGLIVARRWVRKWAEADPSLHGAMLAFTAPIATAVVLSFFASIWIYPHAPRLFWAALGALALVPTVYLLRRVVDRQLFLILDALVVFYVTDQVRLVAASVPLLARGLFLAEMLGGSLVLWILVRARRDQPPVGVIGWVVRIGIRLWLAVFALCFVTDAVGNVSLAELVGGAALGGGYLAVILYAATRIVGGLLVILLRSRPLTLLNGVRRHQPLLLGRLTGLVDWLAVAFWAMAVLALLSARPAVFAATAWFWHLPVHLGAIEFTPSHVLVFGLTVWASFLVSRFVQFVLNEDVYGHVHLAGGLSYAINRLVHYGVIVIGCYIAVAAVGVPLTQLSLIVGALTVGLGFGLQNVVNNFVSGLILLFERPIKVGDLVQLADTTGTVEYIGIRASIIRTPESSEVIVPNGNLLSNQLTNWTLSSRQRGLSIPMSLGADAEPTRVMRLLTDVAASHPLVVTQPPPQALLTTFNADSFKYELRAWTNSAEQWANLRSELAVSIHQMLTREGIAIKS